MPKYTWYGITLEGVCRRGSLDVHSTRELEQKLLHQNIALITSAIEVPWSRFCRPSLETIISFFDALATLLEAGVYLDTALPLLKNKNPHQGFQQLINDLHISLQNGVSYKDALAAYQHLFGSCALELIASGERIGKLPQALRLATRYYTDQAECAKKIKGIILLPTITFCFFLIVAAVILGYIVPIFASLFLAAHKEMPWITRAVLHVSNWCSIHTITITTLFMVPTLYSIKQQIKKPHIKKIKDRLVLSLPIYGRLTYTKNIYQFLETTALLFAGGIHEVTALQTACAGLSNEYIQKNLTITIKKIQAGKTIADALAASSLSIAPQVQAVLAVGEESGTLARSLEHAAQYYKKEIEKLLHLISTFVQPCLMVILGIFITILIFAVYMPVLQLSYVIT